MPARMTDILGRANEPLLADFATSSVLLAFDFDGTLAPIVEQPSRARLREGTRRLLVRLAKCYPCVVISGRSQADVRKRLRRVPLWHVIGNHGREPATSGTSRPPSLSEAVRWLRTRLRGYAGVHVEHKKYTLTVHYRQARDKNIARRAIARAVRALPNLRALGGKQAVNLIPRDGANKGAALQDLRRALACDRVIYVGDDQTDEDAFRSAARTQLLSIRIGASHQSRAQYCLRRQTDIDRLMSALIELRRRTPDDARAGRPQAAATRRRRRPSLSRRMRKPPNRSTHRRRRSRSLAR